ncbi:DUF3597 domain-containing protein [Aquibium carbonis]|uniref:DUF3597 domain-containing protein n=1 Tax=Aquibium carbonis TaxID=2495581 RepID=A0A3S0A1X7_9HYPH|nr:DUF3597 domain-containing protein [Aquibium carbonis]RST86978.1 DUF3597 domain-containing protein [Aquibium carbonis]
MGIFDKIKNAIWGSDEEEAAPVIADASSKPVVASASTTTSPTAAPAPPKTGVAAPAPAAARGPVDVAAILDAAVKRSGQKLDWRKSIVDLMKALGLDSSLGARKELAAELGYTGSTSDSAAMNMWLHKQVIQKLKDNGGQVPAELL